MIMYFIEAVDARDKYEKSDKQKTVSENCDNSMQRTEPAQISLCWKNTPNKWTQQS